MSDSHSKGADQVHGLLLAPDEIAEVRFDRMQACGRIGALLGEDPAQPVVLTTGLSLWTGSYSQQHGELNQLATLIVNGIFRAVADGGYDSSLEERARVSGLLARPGALPAVRGTSVLLGQDGDGLVASVPDGFITWWAGRRTTWIDELEHRLSALRGDGPGRKKSAQ